MVSSAPAEGEEARTGLDVDRDDDDDDESGRGRSDGPGGRDAIELQARSSTAAFTPVTAGREANVDGGPFPPGTEAIAPGHAVGADGAAAASAGGSSAEESDSLDRRALWSLSAQHLSFTVYVPRTSVPLPPSLSASPAVVKPPHELS